MIYNDLGDFMQYIKDIIINNIIMKIKKHIFLLIFTIVFINFLPFLFPLLINLVESINNLGAEVIIDIYIKLINILTFINSPIFIIISILLIILCLYFMFFYDKKYKKLINILAYIILTIFSLFFSCIKKIDKFIEYEKVNSNIENVTIENNNIYTLYNVSNIKANNIYDIKIDDDKLLLLEYKKTNLPNNEIMNYQSYLKENNYELVTQNNNTYYSNEKVCILVSENEKSYIFVYGNC